MTLATFFVFRGTILDKSLKALCLMIWSIGGVAYLYGFYEAIVSATLFPPGTHILLANWCLHIGLRFFALWVPMGFALNHWQMRRIIVAVVYILGCVLTIVFSLGSLILLLPYGLQGEKDNFKLRSEYIDAIKSELKAGPFPPSVSKLFSHECCGWFGPTDFGPTGIFDISSKTMSDESFMKSTSECYGKTFDVEKKDKELMYTRSSGKLYKGCGEMLVNTANRQITFILIASVIIIILSVLVSVLYILNFIKLPRSQVDTRRNPNPRKEPTSSTHDNVKEINSTNDGLRGEEVNGPVEIDSVVISPSYSAS